MKRAFRVVLCAAVATLLPTGSGAFGQSSALGQTTTLNEGLPTLTDTAPERPQFGYRPSGQGFRPRFSAARPGLLRQPGLQDAMQGAWNSPLERALRQPPPAQQIGAELQQAVQAMQNVREARRQQFAARTARPRRGRRGPTPPYVAKLVGVTRGELDPGAIRIRLQRLLNASGYEDADVELRPKGEVMVLEGTVARLRDGRVIEHLLRLEPGVDEVENRLRVSEQP